MRLCNYRLMNAIVFLIKMLVECKYRSIVFLVCVLKYCVPFNNKNNGLVISTIAVFVVA